MSLFACGGRGGQVSIVAALQLNAIAPASDDETGDNGVPLDSDRAMTAAHRTHLLASQPLHFFYLSGPGGAAVRAEFYTRTVQLLETVPELHRGFAYVPAPSSFASIRVGR